MYACVYTHINMLTHIKPETIKSHLLDMYPKMSMQSIGCGSDKNEIRDKKLSTHLDILFNRHLLDTIDKWRSSGT